MDLAAFLPPLAAAARMDDADLLERDVRLHLLLREIHADTVLAADLVCKGGTVLAKCFTGYARFSEDLDFTWRSQPAPPMGSGKGQRRPFDQLRRLAVARLDGAASRVGLSRRREGLKVDRQGQLLTLRYDYRSVVGAARHVKVEVSLFEPLLFRPVEMQAHSLLRPPAPPTLRLADEALADAYTAPVGIVAYDPREIQAEKVRAFLTRGAVRGRDLHDLLELERLGFRVEACVPFAARKVRFSVERWGRYRVNASWRPQLHRALLDDEVGRLAFRNVDAEELAAFVSRFESAVLRVLEEVGTGLRERRDPAR